MKSNVTTEPGTSSGPRLKVVRKQSYFPPQHGAWAFIGLPIALGFVLAPWTPLLLLTAVSAIAAFPLSYFVMAIMRYPKKQRYVKPLVLWSALSLPFALIVLIARPWLIWVGAFYVVALCLNVVLARNKMERSFTNDAIFIIECVALIPVMWAIGSSSAGFTPAASNLGEAPASVWVTSALTFLVLIDSTLHVKSLIRERNDPRYQLASRIWSVISLVAAVALSVMVGWPALVVAVPFLYLIARSYVIAGKELKPGVLGVVELGAILLLLGAVAICAS